MSQYDNLRATRWYAHLCVLGADFDPEELCAAVERGEDESMLKVRKNVGPRGAEDVPKILAQVQNAPVGA